MSKYAEVLRPFVALMEKELRANSHKGDREGWLQMTEEQALGEIEYHVSKLSKAMTDMNPDGMREYAADVANLCMMLLDIGGQLAERDALLRKLDDAWNSHDGKERFGKLMQRVEALSASAEPSAPVERDEHAMRKAFKSWELNKDGPAVGVMPPEDAALDGFIAGADWQSNRAAEG